MDQLQYLKASENTERKFPEGKTLTGEQQVIMRFLSQDLGTICKALDHMKKHLIYDAECHLVMKSEASVREKHLSQKQMELLHAAIGIVTEAEELFSAVFDHIDRGTELDETNLFEEIGDSLWYQAMVLRSTGKNFSQAMQVNIDKLAKRYPEKFSSEAALNRNLDAERQVLEAGVHHAVSDNFLNEGEIGVKNGELHVIASGVDVGKSSFDSASSPSSSGE